MEQLHILDGYGYIFRAYYGLGGPDGRGTRLSTASGMPTGALYVYARMLIRLYKDVKPGRIAVVFDAPGKTFRDELDEQYKATRRETPEDLRVQLPHFRPLTEAFCWPVLSVSGVEADDVIATLTRRACEAGWEVVIHSADKDLMQLVDDHVVVVDSLRQITYDAARVTEKFGVPPAQVGDWLALVGDKSDNVPGMEGVGKVTAAKLLKAYGSLGGILEHVSELKGKQKERFSDGEKLERLELSRKLVTLRDTVPLETPIDELVPAAWDGKRLRALFEELEFQGLLASMDAGGVSEEPAVAVGPEPEIASCAADLDTVLEAAATHGQLAIHVVTDGARPDRAKVVGFALAAKGVAPVYVPMTHRYLMVPAQLAAKDLPPRLAELLADSSVAVICHDVKNARRVLARMGLALDSVALDTMLAAYVLDASSALSNVAARFAGVNIATLKQLLGSGKKAVEPEMLGVPEASAYCGAAAAALLAAAPALERALEGVGLLSLLRDLEQPVALLLADVEDRGIKLDIPFLRELGASTGKKIADIEAKVFELAGTEINLGSPKQLSALLFERLGLRSAKMKKTKTGFSTDHEVLEGMLGMHAIVPLILEHRELVKLKGTYMDALPPLVNPATSRLHTSFNQAVAATGRLSSQDPNLQNIPIRTELGRKIRRAFIASDRGESRLLIAADYSQIELRILAHLSKDPVLLRAFNDGIDVHTQTASEVFGVELEAVSRQQRRVAKAVNYGLAYGQTDFGLARSLDIPRHEAKTYIATYFERFARVRTFMEELVEQVRRDGFVTTLMGRRRPIPDITAKSHSRRSAAERVAQNTPMQGTGADIIKLAMLRCQQWLDESQADAAMLLTVHDELVFEVAAAEAGAIGREIQGIMEGVCALDVPLVVDVGRGPTWADAH